MPGCSICGDTDSLTFNCNYCTGNYCKSHRLPENHNCPGLHNANSQGPDFRKSDNGGFFSSFFGSKTPSETRRFGESDPPVRPPGTYIDDPETSSPDVNVDGSIQGGDNRDATTGQENGILFRVFTWILFPFIILWVVANWAISIVATILQTPILLAISLLAILGFTHFTGFIHFPITEATAFVGGLLNATMSAASQTTDPTGGHQAEIDSSNDRLPDAWSAANESPQGAPLPGLTRDEKHIYVQIWYGENVRPYTEREKNALKSYFADMPVESPGENGIELHIVQERHLETPIRFENRSDVATLQREYYTSGRLGGAQCIHHQVLVGKTDSNRYLGRGSAPGYFSVVDGTRRGTSGGVAIRVGTVVHELLHNIVGYMNTTTYDVIDGGYHTKDGWLEGRRAVTDPHLSHPASETLSTRGFASVPDNTLQCVQ